MALGHEFRVCDQPRLKVSNLLVEQGLEFGLSGLEHLSEAREKEAQVGELSLLPLEKDREFRVSLTLELLHVLRLLLAEALRLSHELLNLKGGRAVSSHKVVLDVLKDAVGAHPSHAPH